MKPYDFKVEWGKLGEEPPLTKTAVLVYSPRLFTSGFCVCFYNPITGWLPELCGRAEPIPARKTDYWAYLPDYI